MSLGIQWAGLSFLELVNSAHPSTTNQTNIAVDSTLVKSFGESNLQNHGLRIPTTQDLEKDVTDRFPGAGTSLFARLSSYQLLELTTVTMWVSCLILAFGLEIVQFMFVIPRMSEKTVEGLSLVAEVMFPICLSIAIFEATPFGLLILVVGLWKVRYFLQRAISISILATICLHHPTNGFCTPF
jgi:hypothetical protein